MSFANPRLPGYFTWLVATPAIPLAVYFCLYTMLELLAPYFGVQRPAYWILGYLGICVAWRLLYGQVQIHLVDVVLVTFIFVILGSWIATGRTGGARMLSLLLASTLIPWSAVRVFRESEIRRFLQYVAGFGAAIVMGAMGVQKGMQRWMSVIAIVGFSVVILRMRGEIVELMKAGIGGKLMGIAALAGLALAILTTVKPEPQK